MVRVFSAENPLETSIDKGIAAAAAMKGNRVHSGRCTAMKRLSRRERETG